MSIENVKKFFAGHGMEDRIIELGESSATVELAAAALGVEPARIAKSMALEDKTGEGCIVVLAAGDMKLDNHKFKEAFGMKAKMLSPDRTLELTGHAVGGVCPFAMARELPVYLDVSLRRFDTVFPAAGSSNSCVKLSCAELESLSDADGWVDVCHSREQAPTG